eukprot:EST42125.1 hypothetical protein SS50377_18433 [Spironucleus salmonicida]
MAGFSICIKPSSQQVKKQPTPNINLSPNYTFFPTTSPQLSHQCFPTIFKNKNSQYFLIENSSEFRAENCQNCSFVVISNIQAVSIDECKNCSFVILACAGSTFIRDCINCSFAMATAQTRTRDVYDSTFWLWSLTGMIVEGCKNLGIYSFLVRVIPETAEKLVNGAQKVISDAKIYYNKYDQTHDFTNGQSTYSCITFPELKAGMPSWQLPPICGDFDDKNGNFSTLNIPCIFKNENTNNSIAINCTKQVACYIASPIFFKQNQLKCIKAIFDRNKIMKVGKKMFDYYVVVEGNINMDTLLEKLDFTQQALVCDEVDLKIIQNIE